MPSTPRFIISSKNCRMRSGEAPSKSVVLVVTRKPRRRAAWIPCTASSNTPSRHTASSWSSRSPSMWTLKVRYGEAVCRDGVFELLLEQDGVGAEIDVLLPLDQLHHQLVDVGVHEGLAAGNAHDGGATLVHRLEALLGGEVLLEDLGGILDLAATRTREIAPEERLEHEDQGVAS